MKSFISVTGAVSAFFSLHPYAISAAESTFFPPCDALTSAKLTSRLLLATSPSYEPTLEAYFSANSRLRPWCFVQPHNVQEVSLVIRTLSDPSLSGAGDWHIAVRSGGHGPPSSNGITNGVTIDLSMMNGSSYDAEKKVASVQPGGRWKDVYYNLLNNYNVTVTGGRDGGVGVGGFLLGGGNSYYTGRNGFGCDTVINHEVVLANGSIVNANADENPKLYKALKGGGMNFGIVTRFDMIAMPAIDIAYGQNVVEASHTDQVLNAVGKFADAAEERKDDALITLFEKSAEDEENVRIVMIKANTRGDMNTTSFDEVNKISNLATSWGRISHADAANGSQVGAGTKNYQTTLTFLNHPSILRKTTDLHNALISTLSEKLGPSTFMTGLFLQPIPTSFYKAGLHTGGNVLGLDRIPSTAILWTLGVSIVDNSNSNSSSTFDSDAALEIARAELNAMTVELKAFAENEGGMADLVYMNYADAAQDPLGSYGVDNVKFLKEVAQMYDPNGWWQERVPGGFKISRVQG